MAPLLCAGAVAGALLWFLQGAQDEVVRDALVTARGAAARPQVADVDRALEAMSLITVVLETKVTSSASGESWRGDVEARVTVPVRLMFGTDLARARVEVVDLPPLERTYRVVCPAPARLATELITDAEQVQIELGWLRFRTRAGEYYLGEARRKLTEAALAMVLSDADALRLREQTRARVEALVRLVLGEAEARRATILVAFDDVPTPGGPVAAGAGAGVGGTP